MNQKNIAHMIGTDVRKDLAVPNAEMYPGPGFYETNNEPGPHISFSKTEKKTKIIKTNDPGPGSYYHHGTVGVIQGYNREEKHPRDPLAGRAKD